MVLLKLLILTLTFYELIVDLDAQTCPKEKGSVVKENCTKVKNSQCQCRGRFVPSKSDSSICKCDIGFGLEDTECLMCDHGYFSTQTNSPCEKWRECKSGVKIPGTRTSDVICNPELNPNDITPPTSDKNVSLIAWLTTKHPPEGAQTQRTHSSTTTTTTAAPAHTGPSRAPPSDTRNYINTGVALLIFGIIGLLVLTAVTCKLHNTPQPAELPKNYSLCRRPVEESGDGSLCSLKLYPAGDHCGDESVN